MCIYINECVYIYINECHTRHKVHLARGPEEAACTGFALSVPRSTSTVHMSSEIPTRQLMNCSGSKYLHILT